MPLSIDTETSGLDLRHGARPFIVTTCEFDGEEVREPMTWEWDVDPETRKVCVPEDELDAIHELISAAGELILHNAKFDVAALASVRLDVADLWPWNRTHDTTIMAHLVASNRRKDLTSLAYEWVGEDIEPWENAVEDAVKESRRYCRTHYKSWKIAHEGMPELPSSNGGSVWKNDYWLPRALWLADETIRQTRPHYADVVRHYADVDSVTTARVFLKLSAEIDRRGLRKIYEERRKLVPIAYKMESRGVTLSAYRLRELKTTFWKESYDAGVECVRIAKERGHDLVMPKGASPNQSLRAFCFDVLKLEGTRGKKSKTDAPTLDKGAIEGYLASLPQDGDAYRFLKTLTDKRSRDTALSYMEAYHRFWIPLSYATDEDEAAVYNDWFKLHPSLNIVGTDTLRWSSQNPNSQNISKKTDPCKVCKAKGTLPDGATCAACKGKGEVSFNVRYCYGPAPDREWWSLDAKNIELRLPAYLSGEPEIIELFERPDDPPYYGSTHLLNFHAVYPELWDAAVEEVGTYKAGPHCKKKYAATYYQWCKNGGFAVQYGAVERADGWGTGDRAFHKQYAHRLLKQRFSSLEALNQACIRFANQHGYVETIPDRTVDPTRGYPLLCTRTERGKVLETVPLNYKIQGSAMWWTAKAMTRVAPILEGWNKAVGRDDYRIVLQVHDEMVFDFPKRANPKTNPRGSNLGKIRVVQRAMEAGGMTDFGIPTPVGCEFHDTHWGEGVTV